MPKKSKTFNTKYFEPSDFSSHLVFVYDNLKLQKNKKVIDNKITMEYVPSVLLLDEFSFFDYFDSLQNKNSDIEDLLLKFLEVFAEEVVPFEVKIKSEIMYSSKGSVVKEFKFSVLDNKFSDDEDFDEDDDNDFLDYDLGDEDDDDEYLDLFPDEEDEDEENSHLSIVHHNEKKKNAHKENSELKLVDTSTNSKNKNNKQNKKKIDPKKSK